jgi:hypothetical protein
MKIINARLRHQEALYTLDLQDGVIKSITAQAAAQAADAAISTLSKSWLSRRSSSRISILTPP